MNDMTELTGLPPGVAEALAFGTLRDPFAVLGPHDTAAGRIVRAFLPGALQVEVLARRGTVAGPARADRPHGLFVGRSASDRPYRLRIAWPEAVQETEDPYSFGPQCSANSICICSTKGGISKLARRILAPMWRPSMACTGVRFAVWAPNARAVSVVGDFNTWDPRRNPMRLRYPAGVWELFIPRLAPGARYKFAIIGPDGWRLPLKADPLARATEAPPATASVVADPTPYVWHDDAWMRHRAAPPCDADAPLSFYEMHAASWFHPDGRIPTWDELAERLVPYVSEMGFTHIELMPVAEHPFGGSWGYQPLGLFAPSARFGPPEGFARFVDACHRANIGVIVDWVPAHFPTDAHGMARFDGTALYEHEDAREGFHQDWNTYIYNFGRREVQGFLIASGLYWLEQFHVDGLRVDAVASMLYRDYSAGSRRMDPERVWRTREPGSHRFPATLQRRRGRALRWRDHHRRGIRLRGQACHGRSAKAASVSATSGTWAGCTTRSTTSSMDPVHRTWHHNDMTFGLLYAFAENFMLPLSHDEVVYGKRSLIGKMPGDNWQRFANLRTYLRLHVGTSRQEAAVHGRRDRAGTRMEPRRRTRLGRLDDPLRSGIQRLVRDLNRLYASEPALHQRDTVSTGFRWVVGDDRQNSVFAFLRLCQ